MGWISLLDGASKFELLDLLIAIEAYLIEKQKEWILARARSMSAGLRLVQIEIDDLVAFLDSLTDGGKS